MIDKYAILPILACVFALMVYPLLTFATAPEVFSLQVESRPEPRIFWPVMALTAVVLVMRKLSSSGKLIWPPHIICLFAYLAFAGMSALWAFSPQSSFVRFAQQAMVVISIVLPTLLAGRTVDIMRGLFLCFALAILVNLPFVFGGSPEIASYGSMGLVKIGYPGYFQTKNTLGECSAIAFLLALHETRYPGFRRVSGIIILALAILLVFMSDSKTALGLAFISPILATVTLFVRKITRISLAVILLSIPLCYTVVSTVSNVGMNRVSYMLYGDSTFTGRTIIWDFAQSEIDRSPLVGWGYQSFWLVGPDAPSVVDAPGWVKRMPNAHNGYYDSMLELGYIGLAVLLAFIIATLHAIGRVVDRNPAQARLLLSLALFIVLYNFLESLWMRGFEFVWVVFVIVAADIGRYWQPFLAKKAAYRSRSHKMDGPRHLPDPRIPRLRIGVS